MGYMRKDAKKSSMTCPGMSSFSLACFRTVAMHAQKVRYPKKAIAQAHWNLISSKRNSIVPVNTVVKMPRNIQKLKLFDGGLA